MSLFQDIGDELLVIAEATISGLTTEPRIVPIQRMTQYPFAYSFIAEAPASRLDYVQEHREIVAVLVLATSGETQAAMYTKLEALRTAIYVDRTLGGICDTLFVSQMVPFEEPEPGILKGGTITVTCLVDG